MAFRLLLVLFLLPAATATVTAQVGKYRNDLSLGVNAGYVLSNVGFNPKVNQSFHGDVTGGVTFRYVCEKYFNTICAVQAEVNYARIGWKEDILDAQDAPVVNPATGQAEQYSRTMSYIQIPIFAHLGWGREEKGFQFFFQAGPQVIDHGRPLRRENVKIDAAHASRPEQKQRELRHSREHPRHDIAQPLCEDANDDIDDPV